MGRAGQFKSMVNLTEEQFIEQYGEAMVVFAYYYKYTFSFTGEYQGKKIGVIVGGSADDIYRFDVQPGKEYKVKELCIFSATVAEGETTIAEYYEA